MLSEKNYSGLDIANYFGCSRRKVNAALKDMNISLNGYKKPGNLPINSSYNLPHVLCLISLLMFSGVEIDREKREKYYVPKRILRMDFFTKPVLKLDSGDNVLAPLSLTDFGVFNKLSQYDHSPI